MNQILKAALGCNLLSLSILIRGEFRPFVRSCLRSFDTVNQSVTIPEILLDQILADRKPDIQLSTQRYEDGFLPTSQAMVLLAILVAENPAEVLEIGTFMGHTTLQMAKNSPSSIIHTVDLPKDFSPKNDSEKLKAKDDYHLIASRNVGREYLGTPWESRIRQHFKDTAHWDFSEAKSATFFFIDGSHTYDYCKSDSEKCFEICGGRGTFLWHDCDDSHPGVLKFAAEWRAMGRDIKKIAGTPIAYWKSF